ncbi:YdcF family protein [Ruminococcus sp. 5_1_39BFAA]|uniref:YdcF family protein n=1 Tax=Ruminococcus sp. 5_1_39BFAA TaxID=457412 RepID=UPI00356472D8
MSTICFTTGTLCLIYYILIILYAGLTADFAWIWLLAAAALSGIGALIRCETRHPSIIPTWLRCPILVVIGAGILLFLFISTGIIKGMYSQGSKNLEYVIVLGAQVKGDKPSRALKKRLDKAAEYAQENPETILILSGGQGSGEDITEAKCMEEYLTAHGIPGQRLILEEKSTTTKENLKFSDELTGCGTARTGILSNNFHICRAVKLARKLGYTSPEGVAAPSDPIMQLHYVVREVFALVKEKLAGNIS